MRTLLLALFCCASAFGANYTCGNNPSTDLPGLQSLVNAGGTVNVAPTPVCNFGSGTLNINNAVAITGSGTSPKTTFHGNQQALISVNSDNVTISGIVFDVGHINFGNNNYYFAFNFQNNTIQNYTAATNGGPSAMQGGGLVNSIISHNVFSNIWGSSTNFPSGPVNQTCASGNPIDCWGGGGMSFSGMDNTQIEWNTFNGIANDAIYMTWESMTGNTAARAPTHNNSISYNTITNERRIPFEIQSQPSGHCPGGCNSNLVNTIGIKFAGNFVYNYSWPFFQSWGASFVPDGNQNGTYMNNTFLSTLGSGINNGFACGSEMSLNNGTVQGNIWAAPPGSDPHSSPTTSNLRPYGDGVCQGANSNPSFTVTYQDNTLCGYSGITSIDWENKSDPSRLAKIVDQYNYKNGSTCPAGSNIVTSGITSAFTNLNNQNFAANASATYNCYVISNYSIRFVNFYLDGSTTPVATQELQDVNTNFGTDRKWLYHATFNVGTTPGTHVLQAVATDVSGNATGGIQTINYTINGSSGPVFAPSTTLLAFGTQTVGTTSTAQTVTITNSGTTPLTFSQSITGDYALVSNTCTSPLAAAGHCTFGVTFTPTIAGARAGNATFTDNAPGTPHVISLTGTGTAVPPPSGCPQNPPNFLSNCGFNGGLTNWSVASGNATVTVLTGAYGPGGSSGVQITVNSISGPVLTGNLELFQNSVAVTANTSYAYTAAIQATRMQGSNNLLIQNGGSFANYGLNTCQPTLAASSFTLISCAFTTNANPTTLGPARFTIQLDGAQTGDVFQVANPTIVTSSATVVTNITFPTAYISHSVAQIKFNSANAFNALRIRYDTADCSGGSAPSAAGGVIPMESGLFQQVGMVTTLGGLAASTKYFACPEVSSDNGTTWSSGASASLTTLPLPAIHPALPTAPITFDTSYPNTTGFATYTVASDCSDLMTTAYPAAVARQGSQGTVISIPAATSCNAANYEFELQPPDVVQWLPSAVNTATGVITLGGTATLTVGQQIQVARSYAAVQTYPASTSCEFGSGMVDGQLYTVASVATGNAVTLLCPDGKTLMSFTSQGTVTSGTFLYAPFPRQLFPIIIRSAAADTALPPPGVIITPDYAASMAVFTNPVGNFGQSGAASGFFMLQDVDPNYESLASNIRFGPGLEFSVASSPESLTSSDPNAWFNEVVMPPAVSNIVFDRIYWHYPGTPVRVMGAWKWNGVNVGAVNSWFDNAVYFRSAYSGLANAKTGSTAFTVASGTHNVGQGAISVAARSCTTSGSTSGTIYEGLDMQNSNNFTLWLPTGLTASCTGGSVATSNTQFSGDASCTNTGAWEKDGSGKVSVGIIACIPVTSGIIGTPVAANPLPSTSTQVATATQGSQFIVASQGPGPYIFSGNHIEGAGRLMNFSNNSGSTTYLRGNYTITQNHFVSPLSYMYGSATSDGLTYGMEEPLQIQAGRSINISGNVFDGDWVENSPSSSFVRLSSVNGIGITDVNMQNNTFRHGPGVSNIPSNDPTVAALPTPPSLRFQFSNNLAWDIGSSSYWVPSGGQTAPKGQMLSLGNGTEDAIISGNTVLNNQGLAPVVIGGRDTQMEGLSVTYNIFNIDSIFKGAAQDPVTPATNACDGLTGSLYAACKFTPTYVWQNNLMIGNGLTPAQVLSAWPQFPSNPVVVF